MALESSVKVPNSAASNAMKEMNNIHPGVDCLELAEDLLKVSGNRGKILNIKPISDELVTIPELSGPSRYVYHQIYTDGTYVFDPRYTIKPILKDEYFNIINELNGKDFVVITVKSGG